MQTLANLVAADPRPIVTYYDMSTSERVELSSTTLANWVAKTSNFLEFDADAGPGTVLRIGIRSHWLRFVWILASWNVGTAVTDTTAVPAQIGLSGPELDANEDVKLAASLRPLGARFAEAPPGFIDIAVEVLSQPDISLTTAFPAPDDIAVYDAERPITHQQLLADTIPDSGRYVVAPAALLQDARRIVSAARGHGSLVVVAHGSADDLARIADQENATVIG